VGNDVAHAKSKKGRAAEVDVRQKAWLASGNNHRGPSAILHETESKHEANGPNSDENEERKRAVESQQGFAGLRSRNEADHEFPHVPGGTVKKASEAELSRDAARKDYGLESIPKHDQKDRDTCSESSWSWNHVRHCTCLACLRRTVGKKTRVLGFQPVGDA